jgi:hypothetical protein
MRVRTPTNGKNRESDLQLHQITLGVMEVEVSGALLKHMHGRAANMEASRHQAAHGSGSSPSHTAGKVPKSLYGKTNKRPPEAASM